MLLSVDYHDDSTPPTPTLKKANFTRMDQVTEVSKIVSRYPQDPAKTCVKGRNSKAFALYVFSPPIPLVKVALLVLQTPSKGNRLSRARRPPVTRDPQPRHMTPSLGRAGTRREQESD
ncbi:hypothetical protein MN608_09497 [Microdochium nivale]|nr:hypothetical protein MN608_09497 [Microdochium nivale]